MKTLYILIFKILSRLPIKTKQHVTYFMSFTGNEQFIMALVNQIGSENFTLAYTPEVAKSASKLVKLANITDANKISNFQIFKIVSIIGSSKVVIFDNYYAYLSGIKKKSSQTFLQIWHALGAIKSFGWEDPSTYQRSISAQRRFQKVYDSFDQIIVGSKRMGQVFVNSWHVSPNVIKEIGYPRSDKFLNPDWTKRTLKKIERLAPELLAQRVVLYAPTYRKGTQFKLPADWNKLQLPKDTLLVLRLHPHLKYLQNELSKQTDDTHITSQLSTEELLLVTDTLITDYSSIVFDYSLLPNAQNVILFTYDLLEYEQSVGLQKDFLQDFSDNLITSIDELNSEIALPYKTKTTLQILRTNWSSQRNADATEQLVLKIQKLLKG